MIVLHETEIAREKKLAFLAGAASMIALLALAAAAGAAIYYQVFSFMDEPPAAPQIVQQTPNKTVARIPTLYAGTRVDCIVIIDQAKNVWSITCP